MEEQKNPIIEMTDNEGNRVNAELFDIFEFENQKYALLSPIYDDEEEHEQMMAVMRLMADGDDYYIEEIATDEEWERVQAFLNSPCQCKCGGEEGCNKENKENCNCNGDCNCNKE